ncbi:Interferon-inducible GTPase 5 [Varanus komodoensis]|uniref:IRG-type G domain-containing protein n=1 Tax=Varanus komodoensis TaxID=61221 RepID=A0A8D2J517_VARKO|nr:interferon-inducible GTPase 5-like [Varanus komodoensis]KAF7242498.1 Interferon-inducible GTPase 5 [Varanus komodoensis]
MAGSPCLDELQLRKLKDHYEAQKAESSASKIQELVDCVTSLQVQVGILGERGAGVTTLIQALLDKPRRVTDPWAYFREAPQPTQQPVAHCHPTYPNLTLHDLPGFQVSEKAAAYLKSLGDLSKYSCFVVVVGNGGLRETHLQILKAIKQKGKPFLLARTKVDLDLHTAERRLRFRYSATEQLGLIRKELVKDGMDSKTVFLVSGLEPEKYEFDCFEDRLEAEVLNLKRSHDGNLEDLAAMSQKKITELYEICQSGSLSDVPAVLHSALENPTQIRLDVAVIGEAGSGKSSLVNSLRDVGCGEPGAAPTGITQATKKATPYLFPAVPNLYLWDLPGVGVEEEDISRLDLSCYDFFLLVASERYKHVHSCLARAIVSAGKQAFFVRSKTDVDMESLPGSQAKPTEELEELQEEMRKNCVDALKKDGMDSPRVFLVSCLRKQTYDLPLLQEALKNSATDLKKKVLKQVIPTVLSRLVRRKSKVLMKDVWGKALHICLFCVENPKAAVAENIIATITGFCTVLGLDEASLGRIAQACNTAVPQLQAQVQSRFAKPLDSDYVLSLITKPTSLIDRAWGYVPYWGQGKKAEPGISFESTYGMLQQVVVELSEDAKKVLTMAFVKD